MQAKEPVTVTISRITADARLQPRAAMDEAVVTEYAELLGGGASFPPVVLFLDDTQAPRKYWLADGYHRLAACRAAGKVEVLASVNKGTFRDALAYSLRANAAHGLRRSNADKHRAVAAALKDDVWGKWSDKKIAELCGVSQPFVGSVRRTGITVIPVRNNTNEESSNKSTTVPAATRDQNSSSTNKNKSASTVAKPSPAPTGKQRSSSAMLVPAAFIAELCALLTPPEVKVRAWRVLVSPCPARSCTT